MKHTIWFGRRSELNLTMTEQKAIVFAFYLSYLKQQFANKSSHIILIFVVFNLPIFHIINKYHNHPGFCNFGHELCLHFTSKVVQADFFVLRYQVPATPGILERTISTCYFVPGANEPPHKPAFEEEAKFDTGCVSIIVLQATRKKYFQESEMKLLSIIDLLP